MEDTVGAASLANSREFERTNVDLEASRQVAVVLAEDGVESLADFDQRNATVEREPSLHDQTFAEADDLRVVVVVGEVAQVEELIHLREKNIDKD